jgi:Reverse transcriptase (RNA-dependent DNA polymerase)
MDVILSAVKWKFCLVYLDDIIVFSPSLEQHLKDLDVVLTLLEQAGASLQLKKCHLFKERVKYPGHIVSPVKLAIDHSKTDAVRDARPPSTRTEVRSFLGLCGVYRRFIPSYSKIASPLTKLLRGVISEPYVHDGERAETFVRGTERSSVFAASSVPSSLERGVDPRYRCVRGPARLLPTAAW